MLHFYEGDDCDFEDPGDPDIIEILPAPVPGHSKQDSEEKEKTSKPETGEKTNPTTEQITNKNLTQIPEPQFPEPVPISKKVTANRPLRINPKANPSLPIFKISVLLKKYEIEKEKEICYFRIKF